MIEENLPISELLRKKDELKNKKLKRREITDQLMKDVLDHSSIEDRFRFLYYYILNDVFTKADS